MRPQGRITILNNIISNIVIIYYSHKALTFPTVVRANGAPFSKH